MKKLWSAALTVCLLTLCLCFLPQQANAAAENYLAFALNSDGNSYYVSDCGTSASGSLTIPDTYNGKPVTAIGSSAFSGCNGLTSIAFGNAVTSIGDSALKNCTSLTSITFGSGVTSIGSAAFSGCTGLTSVTIPDSVTSIGYNAFSDCAGLTSMTIPDGVTYLGGYAFSGCSGLTSMTIPDSVTSIGSAALSGCSSLESLTIPFVGDRTNKAYDAYKYPFGYIFGTYSYPGGRATEQYYYSGNANNTTIPITYYIPRSLKSVTVSGGQLLYCAFVNCTGLTNVTFGDGITSIGWASFCGCTGLTDISIPKSVTCIDQRAFIDCTGLTSITIPDSVTSIGYAAFSGCGNLTDIYYTGTRAQWAQIEISTENDSISDATIHYNMRHVTFKNWDGTVLVTKMIQEGDTLSIDTDPVKEADNTYIYIFSGWDQSVCSGDMEVTAQYTAVYIDYTVAFVNWDGSTLQAETYHYGDAVTAPSDPTRQKDETYYYIFTGWDSPVSATCDGSKTYTAVYDAKQRASVADPSVPTVNDFTQTVVILQPAEGYEYSMDCESWQDSNIFINLKADTEYSFYQRIKETETTLASKISPAVSIKTAAKSACSVAPVLPIIADYTDSKIVVVPRDGYEYRLNDGAWTTDPTFTGLQAATSYTVYQRIAETEGEFAGELSVGVSVTTKNTPAASTSATNYEKLRQYILKYGSDGILRRTSVSNGTTYTYELSANNSDGILFYVKSSEASSTRIEVATNFTLYPNSRYVNVRCIMTYFSSGSVMDIATDYAQVDRATYTTGTKITMSESGVLYITSSDLSEMATVSNSVLCAYWDRYLYAQLGFGLKGLGFISFDGVGAVACDTPSGYHFGEKELRNQREAGCVVDGYTGDYYCTECGEKVSVGTAVSCVGAHSYDNTCDNACNVCSEERRIMHTYSSSCDRHCNICGNARIANDACDFTNSETCLFCGAPASIPGDIDGDETLSTDDAVCLLLAVMFGPQDYPVSPNVSTDLNGDGRTDTDDAVYLLLHVMFGAEDYPL